MIEMSIAIVLMCVALVFFTVVFKIQGQEI
jgi:hypothetical protein